MVLKIFKIFGASGNTISRYKNLELKADCFVALLGYLLGRSNVEKIK